MAYVAKHTYTLPLPPEAPMIIKKGQSYAKVKNRQGRIIEALVTKTKNGLRIRRETKHYYAFFKNENGEWGDPPNLVRVP